MYTYKRIYLWNFHQYVITPEKALSYGAPPHGGIAPGIDRIVMLLANEKNIREVTMFPMNQNAQDLMMNAPSDVSNDQLKELGLILKNKK